LNTILPDFGKLRDRCQKKKYHERLEEIQSAFECIAKLIEKRENDLKTEVRYKFDDNELDCNPIEADDAMKDLIDFGKIDASIDLSQMSRLNEDQKKVFDRVCQVLQNKNQILRLYVAKMVQEKIFLLKRLNIRLEYI